MGLRSTAFLLGVIGALGLVCRAALAEETGLWEVERRTTLREELSDAIHDVFRGRPRLYWDRGIVLQTERRAFEAHVGYEGQFDAVGYAGSMQAVEEAVGEAWQSELYVRRSRVGVQAFLLRDWYFRLRAGEDGFGRVVFQDLFVECSSITRLPGAWWPVIRVGHVKEPMTIDWMNNALRTTFAERAMFTTTIVPNRNPGIRLHGNGFDKRLSYQVGAYVVDSREVDDARLAEGKSITARVTGLPWAPRGRPHHLLHLGACASWRWDMNKVAFAARPESWGGPDILSTGMYAAESSSVLAGELFYQRGRFSVTSEGAWTRVNLPSGSAVDYWGWYAQASCFLSPSHIPYDRTLGCYGRVRPKRMLLCPARAGAGDWEVAVRISALDLDSGPSPGGAAWTFTAALNWYARDNVRVSLNYVRADVRNAYGDAGADGTLDTILVRLAYDL